MKWTVSSFTSEHLQQSLQHCNESISYDESTDYGGRSSATGNTHLPQHRDRCGRWVSAHLQQERTDFHVYGLPLQMCMWFYMTILYLVIQRSFATKDLGSIHVYVTETLRYRSEWQKVVCFSMSKSACFSFLMRISGISKRAFNNSLMTHGRFSWICPAVAPSSVPDTATRVRKTQNQHIAGYFCSKQILSRMEVVTIEKKTFSSNLWWKNSTCFRTWRLSCYWWSAGHFPHRPHSC